MQTMPRGCNAGASGQWAPVNPGELGRRARTTMQGLWQGGTHQMVSSMWMPQVDLPRV